MRIFDLLLVTLAITHVVVAQDSFCVKYAKIVYNKTATTLTGTDEYNLISAIVARVVVGCDNNVATQFGIFPTPTGIFSGYGKSPCANGILKVTGLVNDPLNAQFFNGTAPNYQSQTGLQSLNDAATPSIPLNATYPSIQFVSLNGYNVTANPAATGNGTPGSEGLIQHLVSFFGKAFGCSSYNPTNSTLATNPSYIGKYNGNVNMTQVHQNMKIGLAVWTEFITTLGQTLMSFGVPSADVQAMVRPIVQPFLLAPQGSNPLNQICNQADCVCIPGYTNVNNTGVCVSNATPTPTATGAGTGTGTGTGTAPTSTPAPGNNGTTSPPTKSSAPIISVSWVTCAIVAVLARAFF